MMNAALPLGLLIGLVAAPLPASAQGFGNGWLAFQNDDSRMVSAPELGLGDTEERDYAHADLNNDGWTDLVVVRKEPLHTTGGRYNVLFMNVGGTLLDQTLQYASASTVPGDRGFLTETNDRDVVICDVDQDGWLDVVTATTLSPNLPKAVSHPRVYLNLGPDTGGAWLGLRYEEARIPELLLSDGTPSWPRFTAVDAGDLTGDGFPDLYFGDNDQAPHFDGGDMGDRLLVNDGTGHFVDESLLRMTPDLLTSLYTTSVVIADVSLDGLQDVVRDRGYSPFVSTAYNNPANPGYFELMDEVHNNQPYYTSVGDLNRDGRPELVISNNEADRYRINEGTLGSGLVQWSLPVVFQFLTGGDDGYAGDNYIVDLDADGWNDVVVCDFDVEVAGCERRTHIYHNAGGPIGGTVVLREEAEQVSGGWRGAIGLLPSDLTGTHDAAIFDLDGDGDLDMVLARCVGSSVWLSETVPNSDALGVVMCVCDAAVAPCGNPGGPEEGCGNSTGSGASLAAFGSTGVSADDLFLRVAGAIPSQPALLIVGTQALNGGAGVPFGDGLRCAGGSVVRLGVQVPNDLGTATWGPGLAADGGWVAGDTGTLQAWYRDTVGPCNAGFNLSNGLQVTFSP